MTKKKTKGKNADPSKRSLGERERREDLGESSPGKERTSGKSKSCFWLRQGESSHLLGRAIQKILEFSGQSAVMMGLKANLILIASLIPANCTGTLPDYREQSTMKTYPFSHSGISGYLTFESTLHTTFAVYLFSILWAPNNNHNKK